MRTIHLVTNDYLRDGWSFDKAMANDVQTFARWMSESEPWSGLGMSPDDLSLQLRAPLVQTHAVREHGHALGFIATHDAGVLGEPLVQFLVVRPDRRREGVARMLMMLCEERLYPDAKNIFLGVTESNTEAISAWRAMGFKQVGRLEDWDVSGVAELLMRKTRGPLLAEHEG